MHLWERSKVVEININIIRPNPAQPRRFFDEKELALLSQSIQNNGLLQPILVRKVGNEYELIAGERRLRACKMADMKTIACIVSDCTPNSSAIFSMAENLQRQDLQIFEEAEGYRALLEEWNVTQEEAALRLGTSQSALANKLRLLKLTEEDKKKIISAGLTERHARALLRISDQKKRTRALDNIIQKQMNVRQTDEFISHLLESRHQNTQKKKLVIKDVRIFFNTVAHAIETMKKSGIAAQTLQSETEDYIECIVRIPKAQTSAGGRKPA